jgi:hypothetical protein
MFLCSAGKAREQRLKHGLRDDELNQMLTSLPGYLGTLPQDKLHEVTSDKLVNRESSLIINTGKSDSAGEHWQAVWIGRTGVDFFDPFGLPPLQNTTLQLLERTKLPWTWNATPVQDIVDENSTACGYHCFLFLLLKYLLAPMDMTTLVKHIYNENRPWENDYSVVKLGEEYINSLCQN